MSTPVSKPTPGGNLNWIGWVALIIGLVVAVIALFVAADSGSIGSFAALVFGGFLATLGGILICAGYLAGIHHYTGAAADEAAIANTLAAEDAR